ncbi:hypothetical protein GCM10010297_03510 [Streptomyces malachitofuscus]|nr:hypothetical protein GCM10010297_03510 [Streptomyces malachitofuscus]
MPLIPEGELQKRMNALVRTRSPLTPAPPAARPRSSAEPRRPRTGDRSLEEVLQRRRSVREFCPEPIPWNAVSDVLRQAERAFAGTWPGTNGPPLHPLMPMLGLRRVRGVRYGLYRMPVLENAPASRHVAEIPSEVTHNYADAPVLVFIGGPVAAVTGSSYGELLTRAAAYGHSVWLAARSSGLECSVFALPNFRVTEAMRHQDAVMRHVFTVAVGRPMGDPSSTDTS